MNAITQVFDAFMEMLSSVSVNAIVNHAKTDKAKVGNTTVIPAVVVGAMPPHNSLAAQVTTGATDTTYLNKGIEIGLSIVLNGKHESQQTVCDTLNLIHQSLTMTKDYPSTDDYQIVDIRTDSFPNYIGREDNQFLYGSAFRVRAFIKQKG